MTLKASSIDIETAIVCCVAQYRSPSSGNRREFKRLDLTPYVVQTRSSGYTSLLGERQALDSQSICILISNKTHGLRRALDSKLIVCLRLRAPLWNVNSEASNNLRTNRTIQFCATNVNLRFKKIKFSNIIELKNQ